VVGAPGLRRRVLHARGGSLHGGVHPRLLANDTMARCFQAQVHARDRSADPWHPRGAANGHRAPGDGHHPARPRLADTLRELLRSARLVGGTRRHGVGLAKRHPAHEDAETTACSWTSSAHAAGRSPTSCAMPTPGPRTRSRSPC